MDIPGYGLVTGAWDLRAGVNEYLGGVALAGKRVLEIGPASGFLTFEMERRGAEVVCCDLCELDEWDVVPMAGLDLAAEISARKAHIRRLNDSFWLAHAAFELRARVVYGGVYALPEAIGPVDVCLLSSVLLHLRDPFLALQKALAITRETVIVTDRLARRSLRSRLVSRLAGAHMMYLPDRVRGGPIDTWWYLSPVAVERMVGTLGFSAPVVNTHRQPYHGVQHLLYTLVAERR